MVKWKSKRKGRKMKTIIEEEREREGGKYKKKAVVQSNNRLADVYL
jgi:hypothetical protein